MRRRNTRRASGRIVCDRCVVYGGQEDVEPYTTDSSPPYTTTLRAPSAAIIRTAGTFMPCVFLTPTTASLKLCVPSLSSRIASKPRHRAPARGREHHRSFRHRHRRSAPKIGTPRLRPALQLLAALTTGATSDWKRTLRASNAKRATFGCLPLHAKAQRVTTKTGTAPPRERSTAGDGGAALCARAPRATEKFPKGDYSYTRILAGGNSAEFQGARLDTATRARARHTRAPRSLCAFALVATCTGRPTARSPAVFPPRWIQTTGARTMPC